MLVTKQTVLKQFWYPVITLENLLKSPQAFELLGQKIVLWLTADGQPAAIADRCCHRTAQLSKGQVIEGNICCPYHGWQYNAGGICVEVPQLKDSPIPSSYRIPSYHCTERYGYVWVALSDPLAPIPEIPEASEEHFRYIPEFYERWECSGLRFMENEFDNAHFSFVHQGTFGNCKQPEPASVDIVELEYGIHVKTAYPVINPPLQQKNLKISQETTLRTNELIWFMPFSRILYIRYPNGLVHAIFSAMTPINDSASQLIQFCFRNDTEADTPARDIIAFDRAVTLEDKAILETTDYDVPLVLSKEQHMASDKPGLIMRHKLAALLKKYAEIEQCRI
ncbi:Rieske (2Fe-2S) protein [Scytonema hofmannii PCC 7110]|uniref:Rieske (2Fe-2S) protein n=1 Tax=Scytonema hofmannii PCC 7110 TaxID=128403 RepID=A0A139XCD9_9CYAN|nr:aromatic ring-hydroxylating dioxygenase subunit alpha [Scytonema hofmannii]KYC42360.1 Rieske (2Fe-2S) protein [Scytonema hofmannii PCC 7110]